MTDAMVKLLRLAAAAVFALIAVSMVRYSPPLALIPGFIVGLLIYPFITEPLAAWFTGAMYSRAAGPVPEQFSQARGLLATRQYEAAAEELRAFLAEHPDSAPAKEFLARVLYEYQRLPEPALALALAELTTATKWLPEHERLAMLAADAALDLGRRDQARAALQAAWRLAAGVGPGAAAIRQRLAALDAS